MPISLVDCNAFFVSCERVFRPELRRRPVAVLSNNDGCIVARSEEVKKLGIPMGAPYFKYKEILERHQVVVSSSNFSLYSDLSARVMETIAEDASSMEIYSIDEAFIEIDSLENAHALRKKVLKWTGIPTSIGLSTTKTLAKVATHLAKQKKEGVYLLEDPDEIKRELSKLPVEDIWGIGRKFGKRLRSLGVTSAFEFREMDEHKIRHHFGVIPLRTALELKGMVAFPFDEHPEPKKGVVSSRSFGKEVTTWEEMGEAIAYHVGKAAEKIRSEGSLTTYLQVFLQTNRFNAVEASFSRVGATFLPAATSFTPFLTERAKAIAKPLFYPGIRYKKCGVFLGQLVPVTRAQADLFQNKEKKEKEDKLMELLDEVRRQKKGSLFFLSEGIDRPWIMKREHASFCYTTSWNDLLRVKT